MIVHSVVLTVSILILAYAAIICDERSVVVGDDEKYPIVAL